jgi:hypothetical protein
VNGKGRSNLYSQSIRGWQGRVLGIVLCPKDGHGKIAELTLMQGLGPAIDDAVIALVNQWYFVPATKNGVPVPSVQELHFHYERA